MKGMEIINHNKVLQSYEPEVLLRVAKVYALNNKKELIAPCTDIHSLACVIIEEKFYQSLH